MLLQTVNSLLILGLISGQLIKFPIVNLGGGTLLDVFIVISLLPLLVSNKFKITPIPSFVKAGFIFTLICFLSLLLNPLKLSSTEILTSSLYIFRFLIYLTFGWFVFYLIKKDNLNLLISLVISGVVLAVLGLIQLVIVPDLIFLERYGWDPHYFRTVSTFLDPGFLGSFLVLTILGLFSLKKICGKYFVLLFVIVFVAFLTTFSRSAYLMFFISFITLSYLLKSVKLFVLTIVLSAVLFFSFFIYNQMVTAPRNVDREASANFRLTNWESGVDIFTKHPILGVGFNNYKYALERYELVQNESRGNSTNDSSLIFVAATTGVAGLIVYLYFLFTLFKTSKSKIFISGLTGLILTSFFNNLLFYPFILIWIMYFAAEN